MILLAFFALVAIGVSLIAPWPLKFLADSVFGEIPPPQFLSEFTQPQLLLVVMVMLVGISIFQVIFGLISSYASTIVETKFRNNIQTKYFHHVLNLPLNSTNRLDDADYIYRYDEGQAIADLTLDSNIDIFSSLVMIGSVLVILFAIDWEMTALSLLAVPLLLLSVGFFNKRIEKQSKREEEMSSAVFQHIAESIDHADIVQSFNRQGGQYQKLLNLLEKLNKLNLKGLLLSSEFGIAGSIIIGGATIAIFIVGGNKVFAGELTFGVLLVFITYISQLFDPLQNLTNALAARSESHAQAKRFFEVVDDHHDIENINDGKPLERVQGQIDFRNITVDYGNHSVLRNVNLHIKPGEKVGFIGPSGAGKSTLLSLIPRFGLQSKGFVYIDGQETSEVRLADLRNQIALVNQEPELFSITIGENISFARPDEQYPLPDVMAAAANASAADFIDMLPLKYDTKVNNSGDSLSGGQKQRLAIARAMFKKAPILILDEPTSALDTAAESKVLKGITRLMQGKTVMMVTHKHSLLAAMDTVYVVEGGGVRNVKDYGGLDAYERYLNVHELDKPMPTPEDTAMPARPVSPASGSKMPKPPISIGPLKL